MSHQRNGQSRTKSAAGVHAFTVSPGQATAYVALAPLESLVAETVALSHAPEPPTIRAGDLAESAGLDWRSAAAFFDGDHELLAILIVACREELPKVRAALAEALRDGREAEAWRLALMIEESVRAFGVTELSSAARALADALSATTVNSSDSGLYALLSAALERFLRALDRA